MHSLKNVIMFRGILFVLTLLVAACGSSTTGKEISGNGNQINNNPENMPVIEFIRNVHDFGKITEGEIVGITFIFRNTGKSNLVIHEASASCGCTVPRWDKEPVSPGDEGTLEVVFDSSGRTGSQNKSITVRSNAKNAIIILNIKAEVVSK